MASILNSYILFMAAGQRAGVKRGRYLLGVVCFIACMGVFFSSGGRCLSRSRP
ncbi:MAG: hypothetical protein R3E50_15550 [Halioglobus sp.]